jgi:RND family efflux transporter MFP subunit
VVFIGVLIAVALVSSRKPPGRERPRLGGALVEVIEAREAERRVVVEGTGTVIPRHEIVLTPQVTGKVVWVDPDLVAGGVFRKGEELVRIEPADYELAVQRAEAQVAQAEYQIEVARANASIARREWELMKESRQDLLGDANPEPDQPDPLVLHEPQLRQAEANLASARAGLETAKLNLDRTVLRAPFNCRVRRQSVSPGQLIGPTTQAAVLYGTDLAEIEVGLSISDLEWIEVPGSPATVTLDTGEERHAWTGRVNRTVGVLDEIGRLARVVVQVDDPFHREGGDGPELSIGSFVTVEIEGRSLERTIPLPRAALRENSTAWVAAEDSTLQIRGIALYRLTSDEAFIADGIAPGDLVVLSPLSGAAEGMKLRPIPVEKRDERR